MAEDGLAGNGRRRSRNRRQTAGIRGRDGHQHLAFFTVCLVATRGASVGERTAQLGGENVTLLASMSAEGMGPCLAVEGSTTREVFETYLERVLAPSLKAGQVVVMDNLSSHKGSRVKELVEERGCEILYLPPYSPDLNPIEEAFEDKGAVAQSRGAHSRGAHRGNESSPRRGDGE